jgi:hypothetical protein
MTLITSNVYNCLFINMLESINFINVELYIICCVLPLLAFLFLSFQFLKSNNDKKFNTNSNSFYIDEMRCNI